MLFDPGWDRLLCQSCGYKEVIPELVSKSALPENDIATAQSIASHDWGMETQIVSCRQCGVQTVNDKLQLSGRCPFCGSTTVVHIEPDGDLLAPNGVIPFKIREKQAEIIFKTWVGTRMLAPDKLKKNAELKTFTGMYIPLFTFDADTHNKYSGKFAYDRAGEYANWFEKSGEFDFFVDDYAVVASKKITADPLLMSISDYNTANAKPYTPSALAGYSAEQYSIGLEEAWEVAKSGMLSVLKTQARVHESADYKKDVEISTSFSNIKYKYLLVPIWVNSFEYDGKLYTIVINGQTGKINGKWPKSFGTFLKGAVDLFF